MNKTSKRVSMSRRQVATGVAWTLPAITIAAAAPSLAASPDDPQVVAGHADKCPGASDVPGGWPKHGYRLTITGTAEAPYGISVTLNNGKPATVVAGPTPTAPGVWEYVLDAGSSPSSLTVLVGLANGTTETLTVKASPHCDGPR